MALVDDFQARFQGAFTSEQIQYVLPIYADNWQCYYGGEYNQCNQEIVLNLIAHLMVVDSRPSTAATRETTSRSADGVAVSYKASSGNSELSDFFGSTKYGQRFMLLTSTRRRAYFV